MLNRDFECLLHFSSVFKFVDRCSSDYLSCIASITYCVLILVAGSLNLSFHLRSCALQMFSLNSSFRHQVFGFCKTVWSETSEAWIILNFKSS